MQRKAYLILFFLIFLLMEIFCQYDSIFKIDVGGQSILISMPEEDLVEVGDKMRKFYEIQVLEQHTLKAVYLPKDVVKKLGVEPVSEERKIFIEVDKSIENKECSGQDFNILIKYAKTALSTNLNESFEKVNIHYSKIKDIIGKTEIGKPTFMGTILDIKDAFGYLIFTKINSDEGINKVIAGTLILRIKNRILSIYVYNYLEDVESFTWVSNTIQSLAKSLLELNKEESLLINKNKIDTNQNKTDSIKNLFGLIFNLFKELITKTPITFFCLIVMVTLYYITKRKMLTNYFNKKPNQSILFSFDKSGKYDLLRNFLMLCEFIFVVFIILAISKSVGLPLPSGIF